jgi:hypothetical protein
MREKWNSWWGLHEGDMAVELAEMAAFDMAAERPLSPSDARYQKELGRYLKLAKDNPEKLRKLWWYTIGIWES